MGTQFDSRLVDGPRLLEILFDEESRPSLRHLRNLQKRRAVPFYKLGRLVMFSPEEVRQALVQTCLVNAKGLPFRPNKQSAGGKSS